MNESFVTTSSPASQAPTIADSRLEHNILYRNAPDASGHANFCAPRRALQVVLPPGHVDHKALWDCAESVYARVIGRTWLNISSE